MSRYLNSDAKDNLVAMIASKTFLEEWSAKMKNLGVAAPTEHADAAVEALRLCVSDILNDLDSDEIQKLKRYGNSVRMSIVSTTEAKMAAERKAKEEAQMFLKTDDFLEICSYSLLQCINCERDHTQCRLRELMATHDVEGFTLDSPTCQYKVTQDDITKW